eukprot:6894923-Prymnesium_polylepis.1
MAARAWPRMTLVACGRKTRREAGVRQRVMLSRAAEVHARSSSEGAKARSCRRGNAPACTSCR